MKYVVALFVATLTSSYGNSSFAQPFHTYEIKLFPKSQAGSCHSAAAFLAEQFAAESGRTVFRSECIRDTRDGYDINITYTGDDQAPIVSTFKESGGLGSDGIYISKERCEAGLAEEKQRFQRATNLTAFLSYCYRASQIAKTPWAIRLDAVGLPTLRPYRYERAIFGHILQGESGILAEMRLAAENAGISEVMSTVAHDASETLVLRFFDAPENSQHRLRYFKLEELAKFHTSNSQSTQAECLNQLASVQSELAFTSPVTWFCTFENITWISRLYILQFKPQEKLATEDAPFTYESLNACAADIDAVVAAYRNQGQDVSSAVCRWDDGFWGGQRDTYKMRLITVQ